MIKPWFHLVPSGYILYKAYLKKEDILITSLQFKENDTDQTTPTKDEDPVPAFQKHVWRKGS